MPDAWRLATNSQCDSQSSHSSVCTGVHIGPRNREDPASLHPRPGCPQGATANGPQFGSRLGRPLAQQRSDSRGSPTTPHCYATSLHCLDASIHDADDTTACGGDVRIVGGYAHGGR